MPAASTAQLSSRGEQFAWSMYDWACSAYSTLSITVLVAYLRGAVLPDWRGTLVWSWGIAGTSLLVAFLSPILGALADARSTRREWLIGTATAGSIASVGMGLCPTNWPWTFAALFLLSQITYELSQGFYNSFLPQLADDKTIGRVSAFGYALGYLGGGLALLIFLLSYKYGDALGIPESDNFRPRMGLVLMGLWWGLFSIPTFLFVPERAPATDRAASLAVATRRAFGQVKHTLVHIRSYKILALFLVGYLFYNDGIQTVITQASVFAQEVLGMTLDELSLVILMIQFVALPGAYAVGALADRLGQKFMLLVCIAVWIGLMISAFFVTTKLQFWIMGATVAAVMGGTQSVSRAIMGLMTPQAQCAEFFGFYNLTGKAFSFAGPFLFGAIMALTGSAHWAIASLLLFFLVGGAFILPLDIRKGQAQARR